MILSSADILKILSGNEIIRLSAVVSIVDGKPALSGREGTYIYVDRFPRTDEFQATWTIYIESDDDIDLIAAELRRILPSVRIEPGLMTTVSTTDFRSGNTQTAPEAPKAKTAQVDLTQYEERFQSLVEDVQDQMLLVASGRPGKDGQDGQDGVDGRDGKDIDATETELFDLKNADQSVLPMEKGQVLTWDGGKWTNLYVPDRHKVAGGGGGGSSDVQNLDDLGDVDTTTSAPSVGQTLKWDGTNWVPSDDNEGVTQIVAGSNITIDPVGGTGAVTINAAAGANDADGGDFGALPDPDGGDLETGTTTSTLAYPVDGGDFEADATEALGDSSFDGGEVT